MSLRTRDFECLAGGRADADFGGFARQKRAKSSVEEIAIVTKLCQNPGQGLRSASVISSISCLTRFT